MKLILCIQCNDVIKLQRDEIRYCKCKSSSGMYLNNMHGIYSGQFCIPLGIDNLSLMKSIQRRDMSSKNNFEAFVVDEYSETFKRVDNVETSKK